MGGTVALDLRIRQRELDVIAAVDRQIVDATLTDRVGAGAARSFDELRLSADFDDFPASRDDERDGQLGQAADGDGDAGGFGFGEAGRVHGDGINAGSQLTYAVAALAVATAGAFQAFGDISYGNRGVGHGVALGVFHADTEVAGGGALGKGKLTDEQQHDRETEETQWRFHRAPGTLRIMAGAGIRVRSLSAIA